MVPLIVTVALAAGTVGQLLLSEATFGVGMIAWGCLFGIIGRILQAEQHYRKVPDAVPTTLEQKARYFGVSRQD